jgi:hypothetical protein
MTSTALGKTSFSTGGAIHLQKSHWYILAWQRQNSLPRLAQLAQFPYKLPLATGHSAHPETVPYVTCPNYQEDEVL